MNWILLAPLIVGLMTVLQGTLNRQVAADWGLAGAVLLNSLFVLFFSVLLFLLARLFPQSLPEMFRLKGTLQGFPQGFSWYSGLAGFFGFGIVVLIPFALQRVGALHVFVLIVAAQMAGSLGWDYFAEGIALSPGRVLGGMLSLVSAWLVTK